MEIHDAQRLSRSELEAFFDRLFPNGFAGLDVAGEIAPEGWEQSALVACFHPSAERVYQEELQIHRNIESLFHAREHHGDAKMHAPLAEPTLEDVRREYQPRPVRPDEELTELVASCLWDVFSDNHDVIVADGRVADIGSFRGASAFLDEYLRRDSRERWCGGDHMRFYMGTVWISGRADLTRVYATIFRRLRLLEAEWVYHFPEIGLVDLSGMRTESEKTMAYSPSESAAAELNAHKQHAEIERLRADFEASNARAREEAMDQPPPATVRAYRQVYGRDPRGWPPA
jgi:hypothetical protein